MEAREWFLLGGIVILFVIMGCYYARSNKKFRKMLFGTLSGVAVLYPATLIMTAFGLTLSMNLFNVAVSAILGIPGVVLIVAAQFL